MSRRHFPFKVERLTFRFHSRDDKTSRIERNNAMIKSHFENVARGAGVSFITIILLSAYLIISIKAWGKKVKCTIETGDVGFSEKLYSA